MTRFYLQILSRMEYRVLLTQIENLSFRVIFEFLISNNLAQLEFKLRIRFFKTNNFHSKRTFCYLLESFDHT